MNNLIITVFDNKPEKMNHFINSIEFRGLRASDMLLLEDICQRTGKNMKVSHIENEGR